MYENRVAQARNIYFKLIYHTSLESFDVGALQGKTIREREWKCIKKVLMEEALQFFREGGSLTDLLFPVDYSKINKYIMYVKKYKKKKDYIKLKQALNDLCMLQANIHINNILKKTYEMIDLSFHQIKLLDQKLQQYDLEDRYLIREIVQYIPDASFEFRRRSRRRRSRRRRSRRRRSGRRRSGRRRSGRRRSGRRRSGRRRSK